MNSKTTIPLHVGETRTVDLTIFEPDPTPEDPNQVKPKDLSEGSPVIHFNVKKDFGDASPVITKTSASASEINIEDPENGKVRIFIEPADTQALDPGTYVYDIWVVFTGDARTHVIGPCTFELKKTVTTFT